MGRGSASSEQGQTTMKEMEVVVWRACQQQLEGLVPKQIESVPCANHVGQPTS